jgi:hypothetical protein
MGIRELIFAAATTGAALAAAGCESIPHPLDCAIGTVGWANCPPGSKGWMVHQQAEQARWAATHPAIVDPDVLDQNALPAMRNCAERFQSGEFASHFDAAQCYNTALTDAYKAGGFPWMDLLFTYESTSLEVAELLDRERLSEDEARPILARALLKRDADMALRLEHARNVRAQEAAADRRTAYHESREDDRRRQALSAQLLGIYGTRR